MFKKILIPTDGSVLGNLAAFKGIETAAKFGAEVVAITVTRELENPAFCFVDPHHKVNLRAAEYETEAKEMGARLLQPLKDAAGKSGLKFTAVVRISNHAAQAIVQAAADNDCDLIFIGSNGCAGWNDILVGSVTHKVLATTSVPVLVYRVKEHLLPDDAPRYETPFPG